MCFQARSSSNMRSVSSNISRLRFNNSGNSFKCFLTVSMPPFWRTSFAFSIKDGGNPDPSSVISTQADFRISEAVKARCNSTGTNSLKISLKLLDKGDAKVIGLANWALPGVANELTSGIISLTTYQYATQLSANTIPRYVFMQSKKKEKIKEQFNKN
uniref:Uncharacterized protein n=1 Tax=Glossina pallidipes TaxID=7398 RepID=A0A1A9Z7A6_GLOPL